MGCIYGVARGQRLVSSMPCFLRCSSAVDGPTALILPRFVLCDVAFGRQEVNYGSLNLN